MSEVIPLAYPPGGLPSGSAPGDQAARFTRIDIVFADVDHGQSSYEVRLFLNNPTATSETARDDENGYAGRFHVFGHGGCFGDAGHCHVPEPSGDPTDLRPPHPLTPLTTYVTVTPAVRRQLALGHPVETVTLVCVSATPRQADRGASPWLFRHGAVTLQAYVSPEDEAVP